MALANGYYKTEAGSTLELSGGVARLSFDWLEEDGACGECLPSHYPEHCGDGEYRIVWSCDYCDGGSATLYPDVKSEEV